MTTRTPTAAAQAHANSPEGAALRARLAAPNSPAALAHRLRAKAAHLRSMLAAHAPLHGIKARLRRRRISDIERNRARLLVPVLERFERRMDQRSSPVYDTVFAVLLGLAGALLLTHGAAWLAPDFSAGHDAAPAGHPHPHPLPVLISPHPLPRPNLEQPAPDPAPSTTSHPQQPAHPVPPRHASRRALASIQRGRRLNYSVDSMTANARDIRLCCSNGITGELTHGVWVSANDAYLLQSEMEAMKRAAMRAGDHHLLYFLQTRAQTRGDYMVDQRRTAADAQADSYGGSA